MQSDPNLTKLWEDVASFFFVRGEGGEPTKDAETDRPQVKVYELARELTTFAIRNDLNEGQPIAHGNVQHWERKWAITRRFARLFERFLEHKRAEAEAAKKAQETGEERPADGGIEEGPVRAAAAG